MKVYLAGSSADMARVGTWLADTPLEDVDRIELEARVLGAIIARPWLAVRSHKLSVYNIDDQRNRDVLTAIREVCATHGPLPETAHDMGLAIMRRIDGTPAADRVDLTYLESLVLLADLALGPAHGCQHAIDWFDFELDDLLARRAA